MRLIDKIFDALQQDERLTDRLKSDDLVTLTVAGTSYDIHPTFLQAYINGWENIPEWIRISGRVTWGDISKSHTPGTAPDTSIWLGDERREWLKAYGGIQPTIQALVDRAMKRNL